MVVTIRYDDTGDTETFLLGVPAPVRRHGGLFHPVAAGRRDRRCTPGSAAYLQMAQQRRLSVTVLKAVPYGLHAIER